MQVVIADDSSLWREGLARLLDEVGVVCRALVGDAAELARAVEEYRPDVALIDVRMPPDYSHEGAEAALALRARHPDLGIMLLSQTIEVRFASTLLEQHPQRFGYLLKDRVLDVSTLVGALRTVASGGTVLDPDVVRRLLDQRGTGQRLSHLSPREIDVLALVAEGRSNAAIARHLSLTDKTIERHISNLFTKLDLLPEANDHRRVLAVLTWLRRQPH